MRKTTRKDKPSLEPIAINKDTWFYETEKSLQFVSWVTEPVSGRRVAASFTVPWKKIAKSYPARFLSRGDEKGKQMPRISESEWKWYGYGGHLCVSSFCAYHLATRIGGFLISTIGDYRPRGKERETIGAGPDSFFETFVFRCDGETKDGNPDSDLSEIDSERYATSIEAERGHYRYCKKYASLSPTELEVTG